MKESIEVQIPPGAIRASVEYVPATDTIQIATIDLRPPLWKVIGWHAVSFILGAGTATAMWIVV